MVFDFQRLNDAKVDTFLDVQNLPFFSNRHSVLKSDEFEKLDTRFKFFFYLPDYSEYTENSSKHFKTSLRFAQTFSRLIEDTFGLSRHV